jgi:hypothetical protein
MGKVETPNENYEFEDFMWQLLQAKELSLRLEKEKGRWRGGITYVIILHMTAAELWTRNVEIILKDREKIRYQPRPGVRERQIDALFTFANKMQWPFIAEVQATIDAWLKQSKPMRLQNYTWDWLTGLAFPGNFFPLTIMVGLLQASPWFVRMGGLKGMLKVSHGNFGIAMPQVSYWRNRSILGRDLAALPGIHDIAGWIGPCPSPIGIEPYEEPASTAGIQAQAAAFNFQERNQQQSAKHSAFSPTSTTF